MKTAIFILADIKQESKIPVAKKALIAYFGERLLEKDEKDIPAICVKQRISDEDKQNVDELLKANFEDKVTLLFVEANEDTEDTIKYSNIIVTQLCDE